MGNGKFHQSARWWRQVFLAFLVLSAGGCKSLDRSMFAPRTGEIFQTTRMGPALGSDFYCFLLNLGIWGPQKRGTEWMLPLLFVGLPIAAVGVVVDEGIVSPLTDLVCLPYDLSRPHHGFYLRIVDEDGKPVPGAKLYGHFWGSRPFDDSTFEGKANVAGEFYLNRLKNVEGWFWVRDIPGYTPWYRFRDFKVETVKPEADGRIVLQFVQAKASPGGWKAERKLTREAVLAILPGKWSADQESRRWLLDGFGCPYANAPDRHCFTLGASGKVSARVPVGYEHYSGSIDSSSWDCGFGLSVWKLVGQGEAIKKDPCDADPPTSGWQWGVELSNPTSRSPLHSVYYLGADEKGIYLSPGPFDSETQNKVVLKYRKE